MDRLLAILSALLAVAFSAAHVSVDPNRNYRSDKWQEAFKEALVIIIAGVVLCLVGYLLINLAVGMMHTQGSVPADFCAFCVLIFVDLSLVFFGITYLLRKQQGRINADTTNSTLALSLGKALAVAILSGVASHIGGYIGGVVALGVLAVIGALVNPHS